MRRRVLTVWSKNSRFCLFCACGCVCPEWFASIAVRNLIFTCAARTYICSHRASTVRKASESGVGLDEFGGGWWNGSERDVGRQSGALLAWMCEVGGGETWSSVAVHGLGLDVNGSERQKR